MRAKCIWIIALFSLVCASVLSATTANADTAESGAVCGTPGQWIAEGGSQALSPAELLSELAARKVVLLGEQHTNADHHRWQLHTVAALHAIHPNFALGFEMFQRAKQPVLDRWVAGELSAEEFLEQVDWERQWGFDAELYLPLFHFARLNRVPMIALNVDRALISNVAKSGWDAIPEHERNGVSDPRTPSLAYQQSLAEIYALKARMGAAAKETDGASDPLEQYGQTPEFTRFVEAQVTWDRAMAEAMATALATDPDMLVVGIVGRGHAEYGWGIPHQLVELGVENAAVLLPVDETEACETVMTNAADAYFVLDNQTVSPTDRPNFVQLGVLLTPTANGARIAQVGPQSVAEASGLEVGDIIVSVAGRDVKNATDVISAVRRQPPGTWLPLTVDRNKLTVDVVAKFPPLSMLEK
jgi:uncharacterized iron-regulated protein